MALVKPIVNDIVAFDARQEATITFTASGGDQVTGNTIKVASNEPSVQGYYKSTDHLFYQDYDGTTFSNPITGNPNVLYIGQNTNKNYTFNGTIFVETSATEIVIYQDTVTSYAFSHNIPANTLINGQYYKVAIQTKDVLNNTSPWSNYQPFYCYQTPTLTLNILSGEIIRTSTCHIEMTYNQEQNEKIDYGIIDVYNANDILIGSSGNIYDSNYPPIKFSFDMLGLENHSQYYVQGTVVTINGTVVQTAKTKFYTDFDTIVDHTTLTATLDSCNGYVNLHSSKIGKINGITSKEGIPYIGNKEIDLRNAVADFDLPYSWWVKWGGNLLEVPTDFLMRLWFYPARQPFKVIKLYNDDNTTYISISLRRDTTEDYLSIRTDNGTIIDLSLGQHCNGNTKLFLWIKVIEATWDVRYQILAQQTTVAEWNSNNNNIPYNTTSDMTYTGEAFETFSPSTSVYNALSGELTNVIIGNGVFDHLNITKDTSLTYDINYPTWDENTLLDINFNGNVRNNSPNYTRLILKRRDDSLLNWINLSEIREIPDNTPVYIDFDDSFIPTGVEQHYALSVYIDDIPSEYHTADVVPNWGKYFLSDKNTRFVLNYAVIYSNHNQNIQNGVFMPIGATYPIVVQNGEGNYRSGSLQFKVLGYQFEVDKRLDRVSITKQTDDMLKFLTNGKAKCLTDFNGNIFIIKVINSPQISYDANWGNGITTISFDWVEQGKYNDDKSMIELGLFDYIATE